MMDFSQMFLHLVVALFLGALMGLERELAGKEAGIRTAMMVSGGAAIFSIIALQLPYIVGVSGANVEEILARNSGFLTVVANIVVGVGFLGAGIIIKTEERVHGLTTAAVIWSVAAVGTLAGVGLLPFAFAAAITLSALLWFFRHIDIAGIVTRRK
ncbi:MAG: MgtC/SapB family protein [Patescibacteria group bacterium]